MELLQNIDFAILNFIQDNFRCAALDKIMTFITHLGDKGIIWLLTAAAMLCFKEYRKCAVTLIIGLITGIIIGNLLIKNIFDRSRPCWIAPIKDMLVSIPKDYSFPSGHTMSSAISATILMLRDKRFGIPAAIIAAAIAFSRLYLYVHFPSDVLCGAVLGIFIGTASAKLIEKYLFSKNRL